MATTARKEAGRPAPEAVTVPEAWRPVAGLLAGFGEKGAAPPEPPYLALQVHGARVVTADEAASGSAEADAVVVDRPGRLVAVATADCVPVLLLARGAMGEPVWAAAAHAGWRGMLAGVLENTVDAARQAGVEPGALEAALGPSIGPCCYEVGREVRAAFEDSDLGSAVRGGGSHLDLRAAGGRLLERAGLAPAHIQLAAPCTLCSPARYYSYRGGANRGQRQLSWIGWLARKRPPDPRART